MDLKKLYLNKLKVLGLIFILLIITVIFSGIEIKKSFNTYLSEFEPIENSLDSKRIDLYTDSIYLYKYISIENISEVIELDKKIEEANHKCTVTDTRINTFFEKGLLRESLYNSYNTALAEHRKAENIKEAIIEGHREFLGSGKENENQITQILEYESHFSNAIDSINLELLRLENERQVLQDRITFIEMGTFFLVLVFTFLFLFLALRYSISIQKDIIEPLENLDIQTKTFTEGNLDSQITTNSTKPQIKELESRVNSLFTYVKGSTDNPKKKRDFKEHFLKTEYHEILDILKKRNEGSKATTMKDLKTQLHITHPTLISRLNYLKEHSYIEISKNGRDKIIKIID